MSYKLSNNQYKIMSADDNESLSVEQMEIERLIAQNEHLLFKKSPTLLYHGQRFPMTMEFLDTETIQRHFGLGSLASDWPGLSSIKTDTGTLIWDGERFISPGEMIDVGGYVFVLSDMMPRLGLSYMNYQGKCVWIPLPQTPGSYTIGRDEPTDPIKADILLTDVSNTVHRRHVTIHVRNTGYGVELSEFVRKEYYEKSRRFNMPMITDHGDWQPLGVDTIHRLQEGTNIRLGKDLFKVIYEE